MTNTPSGNQRRTFPRTEVNFPVDVGGAEAHASGRLVSLGGGGAFLELDDRYPIFSTLRLRFSLATLGEISCQAIVRYTVEGKGAAVEFLDIEPGDQERIMAFVEEAPGLATRH